LSMVERKLLALHVRQWVTEREQVKQLPPQASQIELLVLRKVVSGQKDTHLPW